MNVNSHRIQARSAGIRASPETLRESIFPVAEANGIGSYRLAGVGHQCFNCLRLSGARTQHGERR